MLNSNTLPPEEGRETREEGYIRNMATEGAILVMGGGPTPH